MSNNFDNIPNGIVSGRREFYEQKDYESKVETPRTVKTNLSKSGSGSVSVGKAIPKQEEVDDVAIRDKRKSEVLGEIPPPLSQHPMEESTSMPLRKGEAKEEETLSDSEEEIPPPLSQHPMEESTSMPLRKGEAKEEETLSDSEEESLPPQVREETSSRVQKTIPLPHAEQAATTTKHVAFNTLENFVKFFSKSKAEKMRDIRMDGMVDHLKKHVRKGEFEKAAKALIELEKVSPDRFKNEMDTLDTIYTSADKVFVEAYDQLNKKYHSVENKESPKAQSLLHARNELEKQLLKNTGFERISEFRRGDIYDDFGARQGDKDTRVIKGNTPISFLPIDRHVQSVFRLPNKLDFTIKKGDQEKQLIWNKEQHSDKEKTQSETTKDLFEGINKMLGRDMEDPAVKAEISKKEKVYSDFDANDESVNAFDSNGNKIAQNEDVLILKFVTKEMAGYAVAPIAEQLQKFCIDNQLERDALTIPMKDQVERCVVTLHPDGDGFSVESEITIPLKKGGVQGANVGNLKVKLTAEVDSTTGHATISVVRSNLTFLPRLPMKDRLLFVRALNAPLGDALPPPPSLQELKDQLTNSTEFIDVLHNKPLSNAMRDYFQTSHSDELFVFAEELEKGENSAPKDMSTYYDSVLKKMRNLNLTSKAQRELEALQKNLPKTTKEINEQVLEIISADAHNMWIGMKNDFILKAA